MNLSSPSRIFLLRHAKAAWASPGERDFDRPLNDEGYAEAEIIAEKAADRNYRPSRVVSSTAARCRQTAEAVRRAIDEELDMIFVDELYNAPSDTYLELLSTSDSDSVMFIGHNPTMEEVLEKLIGHDQAVAAIPSGFPTAGLAVLDQPAAGHERYWRLFDFLTV